MSQGYRGPVNESNLIAKLQEIVFQAQQAEGLSDIVMVVLAGVRVLGQMIIQMVIEQRDRRIHQERKGPPLCPHCGKLEPWCGEELILGAQVANGWDHDSRQGIASCRDSAGFFWRVPWYSVELPGGFW